MIHRKNEVEQSFMQYQEAFMACEKVIQAHSESFYRAFSKLPKQKAWSVFAIYAFCREADDSIDLYASMDKLTQLHKELDDFLAGKMPERYIWQALTPVFQTYAMDYGAFYDMLEGQKLDADFKQPNTQDELETYAYYVAGTVGLMLLPILSSEATKIRNYGIQLGQAMQLTNILRDVGEDFDNQRIYLPKDVMSDYQLSVQTIKNGQVTPCFVAAWEYEAKRAEALYQEGLLLLPFIDTDCQKAVLLAATFYRGILDAVRDNDYNCLKKRNFVKKNVQLKLYKQVKKQLKMLR